MSRLASAGRHGYRATRKRAAYGGYNSCLIGGQLVRLGKPLQKAMYSKALLALFRGLGLAPYRDHAPSLRAGNDNGCLGCLIFLLCILVFIVICMLV
jgi:hypothetical protein